MKTQIKRLTLAGFTELWRDPVNGQLCTREHAWNVYKSRAASKEPIINYDHHVFCSAFRTSPRGVGCCSCETIEKQLAKEKTNP